MKFEDGYSLYELLREGKPVEVENEEQRYTFVFRGEPTGTKNHLSVTNSRGEEKRFGRGWGSEQVWRGLEHLEKGWNSTQVPRYRHYDKSKEDDR